MNSMNSLEKILNDFNSCIIKEPRTLELSKIDSQSSISALQLIGERVRLEDFIKAEELIKLNFGIDYIPAKFNMLWEMIYAEGWTNYRFQTTLKWFIKNKKFPNWTIADWFEYDVKLYTYNEYLKQLHNNKNLNQEIEWYKVNGVLLWKYKDGKDLPLEKYVPKKTIEKSYCYNCDKEIEKDKMYCSEKCKQEFEKEMNAIKNKGNKIINRNLNEREK